MPLGARVAVPAPGAGGGVRRRLAGGRRCGTPRLPCALRTMNRTLMLHTRKTQVACSASHRGLCAGAGQHQTAPFATNFEHLGHTMQESPKRLKFMAGFHMLGAQRATAGAYPGARRGGTCGGAGCAALLRNQLATALHCGASLSGACSVLRRLVGPRPSLASRPCRKGITML